MKIKDFAFHSIQKISFGLNLPRLFKVIKKGYIVLAYHSIPLNPSGFYDVGIVQFEKHLKYLKKNYKLQSVNCTVENIKENCGEPSEIVVGITFDDGVKDNYRNVYPLLRKYEIPATVFVCTEYILRKNVLGYNMLSWKEIAEMEEDPLIEIGAHSHTHADLTSLSQQDALKELKTSKKILEGKLGVEVDLFSYPHGGFNQQIKDLVQLCGFKGALTSVPKMNSSFSDPYEVGRICIDAYRSELQYFVFNVCGLAPTLSTMYNRHLSTSKRLCHSRSIVPIVLN